jgi:hypothetical protein
MYYERFTMTKNKRLHYLAALYNSIDLYIIHNRLV